MYIYTLEITLKSDTLISAGEGWGGVIDNDVVFDDYGIPYIPARRIKGCLREAGMEVFEVFSILEELSELVDPKTILGSPGQKEPTVLHVTNAFLEDYDNMLEWMRWISPEYGISSESLIESFTVVRSQTKIKEDGVAEDKTLRTNRILRKGITFYSNIEISEKSPPLTETFLGLWAGVLRHIGKMRNRGFGEVECRLMKGTRNITDEAIEKYSEGGSGHVSD